MERWCILFKHILQTNRQLPYWRANTTYSLLNVFRFIYIYYILYLILFIQNVYSRVPQRLKFKYIYIYIIIMITVYSVISPCWMDIFNDEGKIFYIIFNIENCRLFKKSWINFRIGVMLSDYL